MEVSGKARNSLEYSFPCQYKLLQLEGKLRWKNED